MHLFFENHDLWLVFEVKKNRHAILVLVVNLDSASLSSYRYTLWKKKHIWSLCIFFQFHNFWPVFWSWEKNGDVIAEFSFAGKKIHWQTKYENSDPNIDITAKTITEAFPDILFFLIGRWAICWAMLDYRIYRNKNGTLNNYTSTRLKVAV